MADKIILFPTNKDWFADLAEYEKELQAVADLDPYSQRTAQKGHFLFLCAGIADNRELPSEVRREACRLLWVYAPIRQVLERNMDCDWFQAKATTSDHEGWQKVSLK